MMKNYTGKMFLGLFLICALFVGFLYINHDIGIRKTMIESDIRASQKIQEDWLINGVISEDMAAFISFSEDKTDHTYSVYINRPGLSFGYFFRGGGDIVAVDKYISEFTIDGCDERAFISMNAQKVDRLEIDDGNDIQIIDIHSESPFALVLSVNSGSITFYDKDNNVVKFATHPL